MSAGRSPIKIWLAAGPLFAGTHTFALLAATFAGWFENIGGFAVWIKDHWIEATRTFWVWAFQYFPVVNLSDPDRDALTAIAFFLPLSISSIYSLRNSRSDFEDNETRTWWITSYSAKVIGFLFALLIMILVSRQVVDDIVLLARSAQPDASLLQSVGLVSIVLIMFFAVLVLFIYFRHVGNVRRLIRWVGTSTGIAQLVLLFLPIATSIIIAAQRLGTIRISAVFLVTSSILLTAIVRPRRIAAIVMVVTYLLVVAAIWEAIIYIRAEVEAGEPSN